MTKNAGISLYGLSNKELVGNILAGAVPNLEAVNQAHLVELALGGLQLLAQDGDV